MEPLFSMPAAGMRLLGRVLIACIALNVALSVLLLATVNLFAAAVTFVSMLLTIAFVWAIFPQRFELWPEHLRLVFTLFGFNVSYDSIQEARPAHWITAYGYFGMRFVTNPAEAVVIRRRNSNLFTRPHLVISPANREEFLRQLERYMRR